MSIRAWPSIEPARPRSACTCAATTSFCRRSTRKRAAMSTIITGPPTNSAAVNCHPRSSAMMIPSSITRLVDAISNTITAVKLAPLRNSARASATAAYEHEELATPNPVATASVLGESFPSSRSTVDRRTSAWTIADRENPRMSDHSISQVIPPAIVRACPSASSALMVVANYAVIAKT